MQNKTPTNHAAKNRRAPSHTPDFPIRVLGIDPGYERLGIAVIERTPDARGKMTDTLLFSECFRTPVNLLFHERLAMIGKECALVIEEYGPTILGIETLFFTNNQKTAMRVSEARGVILYEAGKNSLEVYEYSPPQIKVATTSHGRPAGDFAMQQHLERDETLEFEVPCQEDDTHSAAAKFPLNFVTGNAWDRSGLFPRREVASQLLVNRGRRLDCDLRQRGTGFGIGVHTSRT